MVIIDTGPIVALFDESEPLHEICRATLKKIKSPLITSWPVLTEAFYLLGDWHKGQRELWDFVIAGGLDLYDIPASDCGRLKELMGKYFDKPMDLADATLVLIAEVKRIRTIFTLDKSDFSIYHPRHCKRLEIIPG
ncbi:MAG: PIN domain-containing protein [Nitrospirota bacterium]